MAKRRRHGGLHASKAAVAALTAALAEEVAKSGILVNAVAPSIMDTPANRQAMPKADFGLWPKVEEVAATILFLASPENRVTRGAVVPVYGAILRAGRSRASPVDEMAIGIADNRCCRRKSGLLIRPSIATSAT